MTMRAGACQGWSSADTTRPTSFPRCSSQALTNATDADLRAGAGDGWFGSGATDNAATRRLTQNR